MTQEPEYIIDHDRDSVTMWVEHCPLFVAVQVPVDGSWILRASRTGEIVGKRIDDFFSSRWTVTAIGDSFATAFGYGTSGPLRALADAGLLKFESGRGYEKAQRTLPVF